MTTLLIVCSAAFALSALAWYFTWAIWIHAPKGWFGRQFSPIFGARHGMERDAHHLVWYQRLKRLTVVLFLITLATFIARLLTPYHIP